jgi:methyltransferase (TIGR00027 family)
MALILCFALITPAAWAVESGMLSITAEGTTAARAIFAQHPDPRVRNDDYLAMKLVAPEYWHYSLMKPDYKTGVLITKTFRFDTNYYVNARTKHMDALLKQAAKDGAIQVVNLGAGYDSRAYRFRKAMPTTRFFEIDLPAMIEEKKRRLKLALGKVPDYVAYVPIDFNTQNIPDELKKAGYDPGRKTFFIWEGVTYYISGEAVDSTLQFIATQSAPGSSVVFDYMPSGVIQGDFKTYPDARRLSFWVAYRGEPFIFGIPEGESTAYVSQRGLKVLSDLKPKDLEEKYLTCSDGTLDGPCTSAFRIMHAVVPE